MRRGIGRNGVEKLVFWGGNTVFLMLSLKSAFLKPKILPLPEMGDVLFMTSFSRTDRIAINVSKLQP